MSSAGSSVIDGENDSFALQLRIGINVEDVIDDNGMLSGDGVNIASRIHQAAEPGQIVVTGVVREFVANRLSVIFHDLGSPPLKISIDRFASLPSNGSRRAKVLPPLQPYLQWSSRPTVAVLPFRTIGGSEEDSYFGEGITDEIITGLSRSRGLYVIARSSTLRYRERTKELRQIASELDIRYILDGSVHRQQTRLRIKCELLDIVGNRLIWSERFDGSTDALFDFQDRITTSVLGRLEPRVRAVEAAQVRDHPTESLDAYHCVLKALALLYLFTAESYQAAGKLLERAIALDPSYPQAYAYLAWWLNFRIGEGWSENPEADRSRALAVSQRAIELDNEDSFVLTVGGHIQSFIGRRPAEAIDLFDQALALNQNSAFAWGLSALTLAYLGRPDEAMGRLQNVWRLNPFDPLNSIFGSWPALPNLLLEDTMRQSHGCENASGRIRGSSPACGCWPPRSRYLVTRLMHGRWRKNL